MKIILVIICLFFISCQNKQKTNDTIFVELPETKKEEVNKNCFDEFSNNLEPITISSNRIKVMMHAKSTPVVFIKEPQYEKTDNKKVKKYRELVSSSKTAWPVINSLIPTFKNNPKLGREILLKNGYIYSDDPNVAYALAQLININFLFNDDIVTIQRGNAEMQAAKSRYGYIFKDGPFAGEDVSLMLYDRLYTERPSETLHLDFRPFKYKYHFDKIDLESVSNTHALAHLYYDKYKIKTLINLDRMDIECQDADESVDIAVVTDYMYSQKKRLAGIQNVRNAITAQISEKIPFDEPIKEYGKQLDGHLRSRWEQAYFKNQTSFRFNNDTYYIYDRLGRPRPPQVCIDFLVDTMDRASGTWYQTKKQGPMKNIGSFNSKEFSSYLRNVTNFDKFVKKNSNWFDVINVSEKHYFQEKDFYNYIYSKKYQPGDIILIKGKTPWDKKEVHFHSFIVFENDPITGVPVLIAGNAGPASLRPWEIERRRTPERYIFQTVRMKQDFLDLLSVNKDIKLSPMVIR